MTDPDFDRHATTPPAPPTYGQRLLAHVLEPKFVVPAVLGTIALLVFVVWGIDLFNRDEMRDHVSRMRNPPQLQGNVTLHRKELTIRARNAGTGTPALAIRTLRVTTDSFVKQAKLTYREIGWGKGVDEAGIVTLPANGLYRDVTGWPIHPATQEPDGVFFHGTEGICTYRVEVAFDNRTITTEECLCDKTCSFI